ncbi:Kinesin-like protein KIF16B [Amphibalanus amphitrite]|uniref:Kinesin-like protein KIF16B n=1 Tax=Amphibalanus amphitrite TaxID=1232801 RepID=A0A6A4WJC4_AMPAM|nr:Kinesin-like protein KIF16B [Amphibalanus amphitrite]
MMETASLQEPWYVTCDGDVTCEFRGTPDAVTSWTIRGPGPSSDGRDAVTSWTIRGPGPSSDGRDAVTSWTIRGPGPSSDGRDTVTSWTIRGPGPSSDGRDAVTSWTIRGPGPSSDGRDAVTSWTIRGPGPSSDGRDTVTSWTIRGPGLSSEGRDAVTSWTIRGFGPSSDGRDAATSWTIRGTGPSSDGRDAATSWTIRGTGPSSDGRDAVTSWTIRGFGPSSDGRDAVTSWTIRGFGPSSDGRDAATSWTIRGPGPSSDGRDAATSWTIRGTGPSSDGRDAATSWTIGGTGPSSDGHGVDSASAGDDGDVTCAAGVNTAWTPAASCLSLIRERKELRARLQQFIGGGAVNAVSAAREQELIALNEDRQQLVHLQQLVLQLMGGQQPAASERTTLGAAADCDIVLEGAGIADHHCVITLSDQLGGLLTAIGDAVCTVDQTDVEREHRLTQGCVITLGECSMFRYNSPAEAARLRRAGVRRASSRLSVLSLSACDLAATRSVESLLTAEKRLSWGSARELSRARQRSQPSLSRARLSVLGDPLLQTAPAGGLGAGPAPTDPIGEDDDPGGQTEELTNGAGAAERSCVVSERPPGQGSSPDLRTPGSLPESCTQTIPADSSSSVCRTCAAAGRRSPQADTASPALRAPGIALSPSTPSPPPASPSPLRVGGVPADSASLTSDSAPPPAGGETGDSEADSLESPIELGSDSELMGAFIEHEVQRRVTEQLAVQEQRLRAERAHQQLMNERQLARLHFTHQRQIRKLKSALNGVYSSVSTLPELGSEPLTIAEERAASTPRLNGSDSPPPASVVTVPRYVLRGAGRDAHFEYEIRLCAGGERYTLYRRFQRFRELHRYVAQRYGEQAAAAARLPPAKLFGRTSETLANERRGQLEEYLRRLLEKCSGLAGCPLHPGVTRRTLADFAPFFQRGVFEFTRAMTS